MAREEPIELVDRIMPADYPTEEALWEAEDLLRANVPDPNVFDYIYYPEPLDRKVDPAEVVDRAVAYRP